MFKRVLFWLGNSRLFSLPMTFMSWLVVFVYALKNEGNIFNGIIALIGIAFAHLATNLFDDYVDYKELSSNSEFMNDKTKSKCTYLKNGEATLNELLFVVAIYCTIAFVTGVILTLRTGFEVVFLAIIGGLITLTYAKLSSGGFSELAVGTAFGPLLFEGVYFVMCGKFSFTVFLLSIVVVSFTVLLVYLNSLLDYDKDKCSGKKSLCHKFNNKNAAAGGILIISALGYLMCIPLAVYTKNFLFLLSAVTIPFPVTIFRLMISYYNDSSYIPNVKWWYYPLDNWEKIKYSSTASFYLRLYLTRNVMVWVSTLVIFAILVD